MLDLEQYELTLLFLMHLQASTNSEEKVSET